MSDGVLVSQLLGSTRAKYTEAARSDITSALAAFRDLRPKSEFFEFPNRVRRTAFALEGTIPVAYRGSTYNIPVCIFLWDTHPYHAPICFVRPTRDMMVKPSSYVDQSGKIYLPYLAEWKHPGCDLQGLLQVIAVTFEDNCPVFATSGGAPRQANSSPYSGGGFTPYPSNATYGMSQPGSGGGGVYNPYQQTSTQNTPYPPAATNTPYPPYPGGNYGGTPSQPYNPYTQTENPASTTTPYPNYNQQTSVGSGGTIQPEHIRASLLSAIEDRIRRRLRDSLGTKYAELQSIRRTREDLNAGEARLKSMMGRLADEQTQLENSHISLQDRKAELTRILAEAPADADMDIDTAVDAKMPLHRQLLREFVEDSTIEDTVYYLGQALKKGQIDLDSYLKHVRKLSRRQFVARATMHKCRLKAGLSV